MKICISGGLGFVGGYLTKRLLLEGHEVVAMDNLSRMPEASARLNESLRKTFGSRYRFVLGDIRQPDGIRMAVKGCEAVYHLAAVVNARKSVEDPRTSTEVNLGGTLNVLDACRSSDVKSFILASTIAVYGHHRYLPYDEAHPTNPLSPYGVSKLASEHLVRIFGELYGMATVNLRFSNIYGTGGAGVISVFMDRIARGEAITVFNGNQYDDFVNVTDAVAAYVGALGYAERVLRPSGNKHDTLVIGSGEVWTIDGMVKLLSDITGRVIQVKHEPPRPGEITESRVDFSRARELLGYRPQVSLRMGMEAMAAAAGLIS